MRAIATPIRKNIKPANSNVALSLVMPKDWKAIPIEIIDNAIMATATNALPVAWVFVEFSWSF